MEGRSSVVEDCADPRTASSSTKEMFCYFHYGGEFVKDLHGNMHYDGGRSNGGVIKEGMLLEELIRMISSSIKSDVIGLELKYTLKFDETTFVDLVDDTGVEQLMKFNDNFAHVYIIGTGHQNMETTTDLYEGLEFNAGNLHSRTPDVNDLEGLPCETSSVTSITAELNAAKWTEVLLGQGQIFPSAEAVRQTIYKYSIAHNFGYQFVKNNREKIIVKCKMQGCNWKLTAYALGKSSSFLRVTTFHNEHIHSSQDCLVVGHKPRCTLTSSIIIDEVRYNVDKSPNQIRDDLFREYGLSLTYSQAWRGKERAMEEIHGLPEQSYMLIPWLCNRLIETDPNTVAKWEAFENNRFERVFIAYGCCIKGFKQSGRPILFVDGTHLSGPYQGTLLGASTLDANNNLFPVGYAVVGGETLDNWSWFLQNIKVITGSEITIVSDRHNAIILAVRDIFGGERHAFCYRHVKENFSSEFNKVCKAMGRKAKDDSLKLLDAIAYARLECDFQRAMENLRAFSPALGRWVEDHGNVDRWALARFSYPRWENITTNSAESFNAWLVKERRHNVCAMINEHRDKLRKKFVAVRQEMSKWTNGVGPRVEEKLKASVKRAETMQAELCGGNIISVRTGSIDVCVNLTSWECTCKAWQMSGIPCPHACAAIRKVHGNLYNFVGQYYLVSSQEKMYSGIMHPIETHDMPKLNALTYTDYLTNTFLLPPVTSRPPGRPRQERVESQFQNKKTYHCSRCQEAGHTRKRCRNPNPS